MSSLSDAIVERSVVPRNEKLQKLSPKHREVLSLIAQGVKREEVAAITDYAPDYISWLLAQDVCKAYLDEMNAVVDFRLVAMTAQSVDTIADVMQFGSSDERLKAAKLQLEAIGRVGAGKSDQRNTAASPDHLQQLADRLVGLLKSSREGVIYENEIENAELLPCASVLPTQNTHEVQRS